jgi:hypothetical protein
MLRSIWYHSRVSSAQTLPQVLGAPHTADIEAHPPGSVPSVTLWWLFAYFSYPNALGSPFFFLWYWGLNSGPTP